MRDALYERGLTGEHAAGNEHEMRICRAAGERTLHGGEELARWPHDCAGHYCGVCGLLVRSCMLASRRASDSSDSSDYHSRWDAFDTYEGVRRHLDSLRAGGGVEEWLM